MSAEKAALLARRMLGSYPSLNLHDPEIYITELIALFTRYPEWAAEEAMRAAKRESPKFIPSVPEVQEHCEIAVGPTRRAMEWQAGARKQLSERKEIEQREPTNEERASTLEHIRREMAAAGMPIMGDKPLSKQLTPEQFKERFGLTDAEFAALPELPKDKIYWEGKRSPGQLGGIAQKIIDKLDPAHTAQ